MDAYERASQQREPEGLAKLLNGPTGVNAIATQIANLLNRILGNL